LRDAKVQLFFKPPNNWLIILEKYFFLLLLTPKLYRFIYAFL